MASGRVTVTSRDEKGQTTWVVRAAESSGQIVGEASTIKLKRVEGDIYMDGKKASSFEADEADADQATRSLVLRGHVKLVSEPGESGSKLPSTPVTISAQRAKWLDSRKVVAAQGSVWVRSSVYEMGEYAELWATQDLKKIATPDRFEP